MLRGQIAREDHRRRSEKQDWNNLDLAGMYEEIGSILGVAKKLGNVSDNAVRKQMKKRGITLH